MHKYLSYNTTCVSKNDFYKLAKLINAIIFRMDDYRMARRVLMAEVSGGRVRGRPRLGWMDGVKVALGNRGMTVEAARQCAKDRKAWRALVHM